MWLGIKHFYTRYLERFLWGIFKPVSHLTKLIFREHWLFAVFFLWPTNSEFMLSANILLMSKEHMQQILLSIHISTSYLFHQRGWEIWGSSNIIALYKNVFTPLNNFVFQKQASSNIVQNNTMHLGIVKLYSDVHTRTHTIFGKQTANSRWRWNVQFDIEQDSHWTDFSILLETWWPEIAKCKRFCVQELKNRPMAFKLILPTLYAVLWKHCIYL